uniref:non-specific serine/threonine protein kinase n=1 Tax=Gongylonema pulchrum TaxID=637853 RepID=A0A183ERZ7_9BILA
LKPWSLVEVLTQKYDWSMESAAQFSSFLIPMLAFDQDERATARQCLQHDWLKPNGGKPIPSEAQAASPSLSLESQQLEQDEQEDEEESGELQEAHSCSFNGCIEESSDYAGDSDNDEDDDDDGEEYFITNDMHASPLVNESQHSVHSDREM